MFKKEKENKEKIQKRIDELLKNKSVLKSPEKEILLDYRERIEKSKNLEFELVHFRNALLPLVISSQLSQEVLSFYKELRAQSKVAWGEGSSLLTGISQFPQKRK